MHVGSLITETLFESRGQKGRRKNGVAKVVGVTSSDSFLVPVLTL